MAISGISFLLAQFCFTLFNHILIEFNVCSFLTCQFFIANNPHFARIKHVKRDKTTPGCVQAELLVNPGEINVFAAARILNEEEEEQSLTKLYF